MDKIVCIGKNYVEHAKELGDSIAEKPVVFLKPPSILKSVSQGETVEVSLPINQGSVHHECEIVLKLKNGGFRMSLMEAEQSIGAVTVGLDMTLRDLQSKFKKSGAPWTTAKVFPDSAIVGPWKEMGEFSNCFETQFSLQINGVLKQEGVAKQMTLSPKECVAYLSEFFPLCAGDLIFTGTPKGVAQVVSGDKAWLTFGNIQYGLKWYGQ